MKNKWLVFSLFLFFLTIIVAPKTAFADAVVGDTIITLGENLTEEQKQSILKEMNAKSEDTIITVSNAEEHQYLGNYISKAQIGSRAISSSKITLKEKGSGINVTTNHINWVTEEMYANALITAGVKDADVYVTAPFNVSGTAALTGLIKAYEESTDAVIPEEQKQVANEEMVRTAELSDRIGADKASELMTRIKEEIAENPPETKEDLRSLINKIAQELGINLTEEELNKLVELFNKMKDLNIDWDQVKGQLSDLKDNLSEVLNKEETKNFFEKIIDWFIELVDKIKNFFNK